MNPKRFVHFAPVDPAAEATAAALDAVERSMRLAAQARSTPPEHAAPDAYAARPAPPPEETYILAPEPQEAPAPLPYAPEPGDAAVKHCMDIWASFCAPPTCATCQHWDPSEPPHPSRHAASDPRRRCGALSTAQDPGHARPRSPVLIVPLAVSGPQTAAVYTPPTFACAFHQRHTA